MTENAVQDIDALLRAGIDAAKGGDRARARELLLQVVEADERRLQAWLWLSGLVDSLEDREVCLENALALDPGNRAARRGLEWVQAQKGPAPQPQAHLVDEESVDADRDEPSPAPAPAASEPPSAPTRPAPGPLWADPPSVLLCPHCAALTGETDRYCPVCNGSLWVKFPRRETHSIWLWNLMVLRMAAAVVYAVAPLAALAIVARLLWGEFDPFPLLPAYLGLEHNLDPALVRRAMEMLPPIYALPAFSLAAYSLLLLVGMYMRWRAAFYLLVAGSLGRLAAAVGVSLLSEGYYLRICGGTGIVAAIASMLLLMLVYDDFCRDTKRVYFVLDQRHSGGVARLEQARVLGEQGMWALAVLYLRAAAGRLPSQSAPFLRLAQAYLRLRRPDLARGALETARRLDPYHPLVAELDALLAS